MATKVNKDWLKDEYYKHSKKGSLYKNHPGMKILKKLSEDSQSILDLGCGEGTRLNYLCKKEKCLGVDISPKAINLAKKSYPKLSFRMSDLSKLPLDSNSFDLVYSAFVLEHIDEPEKMIGEAIRVTRKGGLIAFVAPNYGAPNRCSPPFNGSRLKKLLSGFIKDFTPSNKLNWNKVIPLVSRKKVVPDGDTSIEPYMRTLACYLKKKGLKRVYMNSCWGEEAKNPSFYQKVFRLLSFFRIYPFYYWGPHFVVVYKK